jgi:small subunit ribosomal protein S4e
MAPLFWGINRKNKRFAITVKPGSHSKNRSIPTALLLRDVLKVVTTLREAKSVIYNGKVNVDGVIRKSLHHSIGLMDVIELQGISDIYRLVPTHGHILQPIKIDSSEKSKKIVKVTSKTTTKGKKTQLGFHDGRTIIADNNVNVGDSCLIQIPEQKILDVIKLEKDSLVIVTRGANTGQIGHLNNINEATFTLPKRINLTVDKKKFEMPSDLVIAIGKEKPVIQVR